MTQSPQGETSVRPRITYKVEFYGEEKDQELPFVVGVVGDFSGKPTQERQPLEDRRFLEISLENFEEVQSSLVSASVQELQDGGHDRLASSWRGVLQLVEQAAVDPGIKVEILDLTKAELATNFQTEFDIEQSPIFRQIYEEKFGQFGGTPLGLLLVDFGFSHDWNDVNLLENLAKLGSAAMCLVVTSAAPGIMHAERWEDIKQREQLSPVFSSSAYLDWRALRQTEEARHLVLTLPGVNSTQYQCRLSGVYVAGISLLETYVATGEWNVSHALDGLGPAELLLSDEHRTELIHCGFLPVGQGVASENFVAEEVRTLYRAKQYPNRENLQDAEAATLIPILLSTMQFGRTIKCIVRDQIGSFRTDADLESYLNHWIQEYVSEGADKEGDKPGRLLAEARVEVVSLAGLKNRHNRTIVLHLRPLHSVDGSSQCTRYEMKIHQTAQVSIGDWPGPMGAPVDDV